MPLQDPFSVAMTGRGGLSRKWICPPQTPIFICGCINNIGHTQFYHPEKQKVIIELANYLFGMTSNVKVTWEQRLGRVGAKEIESRLSYFSKTSREEVDVGIDFRCELVERLNKLPKTSEKMFGDTKLDYHRNHFCIQRKRIARKLGKPRLNRITFKTLRHWKATMEYHKTKDILHVTKILGHKNIKNTLIYTQLINVEGDEYTSKVAWNLEEARKLVDAGFDYITDMEGAKIFRKRK